MKIIPETSKLKLKFWNGIYDGHTSENVHTHSRHTSGSGIIRALFFKLTRL